MLRSTGRREPVRGPWWCCGAAVGVAAAAARAGQECLVRMEAVVEQVLEDAKWQDRRISLGDVGTRNFCDFDTQSSVPPS